MDERRTYLGAVLHSGLGPGGAESLFLDASGEWRFADDWQFGASWRSGSTWAKTGGVIADGSRLRTSAWALDLGRENMFNRGDLLSLRVSQPLRVESGGLNLRLPVGYSYATRSPIYGDRLISLTPKGREIDAELLWRSPLYSGSAMVSLFYRRNPGHFSNARDDTGVAANWLWQF